MLMPCANCGAEFEATPRQWKRFRNLKRPGCCSEACAYARVSALKKKPIPMRGPCGHCGKYFESRRAAMFCGMDCYKASDRFREIQAAAVAASWAAKQLLPLEDFYSRPPKMCLHCGKEMRGARKAKKFCNSSCYRGYMVERFDRWLSNPQRLGALTNYDEFLTQDELPCLVDGCGWVGHGLSAHMNFAHGVSAEEFKRAAGFNLKTGVVSAPLRDALESREHIRGAFEGVERPRGGNRPRGYVSRESKEHHAKARALAGAKAGPTRVCVGCGIAFAQTTVYGLTKFHATDCRDEHYRRQGMARRQRPHERTRTQGGQFVRSVGSQPKPRA